MSYLYIWYVDFTYTKIPYGTGMFLVEPPWYIMDHLTSWQMSGWGGWCIETDAIMDERGCIGRRLNVDGPAEVEKKAFVPEEEGGFKIKECKTQVSFKSRDVLLVG